ncbi:PQQ-dependent sugar dehydrogenase [Haloferula sargassicola]
MSRWVLLLLSLAPPPAWSAPMVIADPVNAALVTPHRIETIATNLRVPWELRFLPDGRQIFTERIGRVRLIDEGRLVEKPALTLDVAARVKMGLLGLALSPDFENDDYVFLAWNREVDRGRYELRVERYRLDGSELVEPKTIIEGIPAWENHTGCRLEFGPDGKLWITTGDANDPPPSQQLNRLNGKILRLNPDGTIPEDNPFVGQADVRTEIWSYGHRNPQGLAFQPGTGRLFESEHGPNHGDEINRIEKGANYGWPVISHSREAEGMRAPLIELSPAVGPGRLLFYQGSAFPELRGTLLLACLRGSAVERIILDGDGRPTAVDRLWHNKWGRIRFINEAPDGSLWLSTSMFDPPEAHGAGPNDLIIRITADPAGTVESPAREITAPAVSLTSKTRDPDVLISVACASCHGPTLEGGLQRNLLAGEWQHAGSDEDLERVIAEGLPALGMPPSKEVLNESQIRILADFLREKRR